MQISKRNEFPSWVVSTCDSCVRKLWPTHNSGKPVQTPRQICLCHQTNASLSLNPQALFLSPWMLLTSSATIHREPVGLNVPQQILAAVCLLFSVSKALRCFFLPVVHTKLDLLTGYPGPCLLMCVFYSHHLSFCFLLWASMVSSVCCGTKWYTFRIFQDTKAWVFFFFFSWFDFFFFFLLATDRWLEFPAMLETLNQTLVLFKIWKSQPEVVEGGVW